MGVNTDLLSLKNNTNTIGEREGKINRYSIGLLKIPNIRILFTCTQKRKMYLSRDFFLLGTSYRHPMHKKKQYFHVRLTFAVKV